MEDKSVQSQSSDLSYHFAPCERLYYSLGLIREPGQLVGVHEVDAINVIRIWFGCEIRSPNPGGAYWYMAPKKFRCADPLVPELFSRRRRHGKSCSEIIDG
jgi:hypothetical protein